MTTVNSVPLPQLKVGRVTMMTPADGRAATDTLDEWFMFRGCLRIELKILELDYDRD